MAPTSKASRKASKRAEKGTAKALEAKAAEERAAEQEAARAAEKEARAAEEATQAAAEASRREEEDRQLKELKEVQEAYSQAARVLILQRSLLEANTEARPSTAGTSLKARDSSVKRNVALIKRLRALTEDTRQAVLEDIERVNQSKYVTEAVAALAEAPLKAKDIPAAVQVCSALQQVYPDFGGAVVQAVAAATSPPPAVKTAASEAADAAGGGVARRRIVLRLLAALLTVGVGVRPAMAVDGQASSGGRGSCGSSGWQLLTDAVQQLARADFKRDREEALVALSVAGSFAKAERGGVLGFSPKDPVSSPDALLAGTQGAAGDQARQEAMHAKSLYEAALEGRVRAPLEVTRTLLESLGALAAAAGAALEREHAALQARQESNTRLLTSRGDLPEHLAEAFEGQRRAVEAMHRAATALAEPLDRSLPPLPESSLTRTTAGDVSVIVPKDKDDLSGGLFEDEDTRAFYEDFPDLHALLPSLSLDPAAAEATNANDAPAEHEVHDGDGGGNDSDSEADSIAGTQADGAHIGTGDAVPDSGAAGAARAAEVRALLEALPTCVSREMCDNLVLSFCLVHSKGARKRMTQALCEMPRGGLQLLPYYMRIAAALSRVFPEIGQGVVRHLESEFKRLQRRRDAIGREGDARLRNVRALGELAKFRIVPFGSVLSRLKVMLDDFSGHNVEATAALLDTAGRFLYRLPETHDRMATMAEVMMKLKKAKNLDARQNMLLEHAYYQVRPPERATLKRKLKPPLQAYVCYLLQEVLTTDTVQLVLRKLRKLQWAENEPYLVRKLLHAARGKVGAAPLVASLTAGLARYHPSLSVRLADSLLEDIRQSLDVPDRGRYQVQVGQARLLGECYNYRLLPSRVVMDTLHVMLAAGHQGDPAASLAADPPTSYFRIRLVSVVLEACGQYFSKGPVAARLDGFLLYLGRYLRSKPDPPQDVLLDLQELLEGLRPGFQLPASFQEAAEAVAGHEAKLAEEEVRSRTGAGGLPAIDEDGGDDSDDASLASGEGRRRAPDDGEGVDEGADCASLDGSVFMEDEEEEEEVRRLREAAPDVDSDFEAEFAELIGPQGHTARLPAVLPSLLLQGTEEEEEDDDVAPQQQNTMGFKVMVKRGGRPERSREVQLPLSGELAAVLQQRDAQEAAERAQIKRLTLQASSAQFAQAEEEERQRQWQRRQAHRNPPPPPAAPQQPPTQAQQQSASLLPGVSADQLPQWGGIRGGSRRGGRGGRGDGGARSRT